MLVSENAPIPGDRRVWNESRTLAEAGWQVAVVCPMATDRQQPAREMRDGIEIHRYPLRPASSPFGYVREYGQAFWRLRRLVRRVQRGRAFDVVHAANPPDFLLLAARSARAQGARFIFDHHDLMPELFRARFGRSGLSHKLLLAIERRTMRSADVVIATNESYRRIAIERGGVSPGDVFVVRNDPDLGRFQPVAPDSTLLRGRRYLIAYLGRMGPQDGIDHAIRALSALRALRKDDWRAVFIGEGDVRPEMEALAAELGLSEAIEFAGWHGDREIRRILSTADVCLAPDPPSPLNDASTMKKVPEYMAMGCAIASYDLPETRVSAGPAAAYVASSNPEDLGRCVHELLEDDSRREKMGREGRRRVSKLSWEQSAASLLAAYERATASEPHQEKPEPREEPSRIRGGPGPVRSPGGGGSLRSAGGRNC
jgi:glycosyltransferase involved in cell wall biosynthesis